MFRNAHVNKGDFTIDIHNAAAPANPVLDDCKTVDTSFFFPLVASHLYSKANLFSIWQHKQVANGRYSSLAFKQGLGSLYENIC